MKKNKSIILILVLLLLLVLGILMFLYIKTKKDFAEMKSLSSSVFEYSKQSEQILNLRTNSEKFRGDIAKINGYLVSSGGEVDFIEKIENLARKQNLSSEITSVSIDNDKVLYKDGLEYLVLNLKTYGSWNSTFTFLSMLENMPYNISVEKAGFVYIDDKDIKNRQSSGFEGVFSLKVLKKIK
jgi:hypothetical protein